MKIETEKRVKEIHELKEEKLSLIEAKDFGIQSLNRTINYQREKLEDAAVFIALDVKIIIISVLINKFWAPLFCVKV